MCMDLCIYLHVCSLYKHVTAWKKSDIITWIVCLLGIQINVLYLYVSGRMYICTYVCICVWMFVCMYVTAWKRERSTHLTFVPNGYEFRSKTSCSGRICSEGCRASQGYEQRSDQVCAETPGLWPECESTRHIDQEVRSFFFLSSYMGGLR